MKKRISLLAAPLAASAILLSSNVFAGTQTEIGVSYGNLVVGDTDASEGFKSDDAVVIHFDHKLNEDLYIEGKYATSETEADEVGSDYTGEFDQLEVGAGFIIDTGNSIFDTIRAGGGYFKQDYDYDYDSVQSEMSEEVETTMALSSLTAEGFYLKAGVDVNTSVKGLTLGGQYTYYVGDLEVDGYSGEVDYEYGVATVDAEYKVNSAISLNAATDFADSETGYRVGIAYKF